MKKIEKILVPTDFSNAAKNALHHAVLMADKMGAVVTLLHVINPEAVVSEMQVMVDVGVKEKMTVARSEIDSLRAELIQKTAVHVKKEPVIHGETIIGGAESEIGAYAHRNNYDLICMGTRNEHGALDKIFGSISANVIKDAPCPVFVIPELAKYKNTITVAYATNLLKVDPYEIWKVAKLLEPIHPIIRCVHFYEENNRKATEIKMSELIDFFEEKDTALQFTFHEITTKDKVNEMLIFLKDYDIDMLAAYRPHRGFWESILHKSFTNKMALETKVPLLII